MENYIMLNGKKINLPDDVDEVSFIRKKPTTEEKKNLFERTYIGYDYFYIDEFADIKNAKENYSENAHCRFRKANYCTDKNMMEQRALHETLNRLLWRYSEYHGGDNEWTHATTHFYIYKNADTDTFCVDNNVFNKTDGCIYFKDSETAQSAIEEIVKPFMVEHPDFVW